MNAQDFIQIKHLQSNIQNSFLLQYLRSIGLKRVANGYLQECYYDMWNNKTSRTDSFVCLAFENTSGGYELKNKRWTGRTGTRDISKFSGDPEIVDVFSNWIDWLSYLMINEISENQNTSIVLNGLLNDRVFKALRNYHIINLYLPLTHEGRTASQVLISKFPQAINRSETLHPNHIDLNEYLIYE